LLDPSRLTWAQVSEVDLASKRTQVEMVPDHYSGLFSFSGWYELREGTEGHCCQHFEGDLRVHLPLLGPLAERAIANGIRDNLAATAQLVERYLATNRPRRTRKARSWPAKGATAGDLASAGEGPEAGAEGQAGTGRPGA
jgi:hypothetical protein